MNMDMDLSNGQAQPSTSSASKQAHPASMPDWCSTLVQQIDSNNKAQINNLSQQLTQAQKAMDSRLVKIETSVTLARASAADHQVRLGIMEDQMSESKRIRILACNVRFVPLQDVDPRFALNIGMSESAQNVALTALMDFVKQSTKYEPIARRCKIVTSKMNMFYVLTFASEMVADEVRAAYEKFAAVKLFTGEDLTYRERQRRYNLMSIMKQYWQRGKIPLSRFQRDSIKCIVDEDERFAVLTLEQAQDFIKSKRIKPYREKNALSGQS